MNVSSVNRRFWENLNVRSTKEFFNIGGKFISLILALVSLCFDNQVVFNPGVVSATRFSSAAHSCTCIRKREVTGQMMVMRRLLTVMRLTVILTKREREGKEAVCSENNGI